MDLHSVGLYGTEPPIDDDGNAPLLNSTLAEPPKGAHLDKFRDVVGKIMTLLGRTQVAEEWGSVSVLLPLAEHWRQETAITQQTSLERVKTLHERLLTIAARERRGIVSFIFSGQLVSDQFSTLADFPCYVLISFSSRQPPLQQILIGVSLRDATECSPSMERAKRWFPKAAVSSSLLKRWKGHSNENNCLFYSVDTFSIWQRVPVARLKLLHGPQMVS